MRAFTAIDLPEEIKHNILELEKNMPLQNLTIVDEAAMHITLHFFAEINERQAAKIVEVISGMHTGSFSVAVSGTSYFGDRDIRVVYAKVADPEGRISALYENIGKILMNERIPFDRKDRFTPHITLARCKKGTIQLRRFIEEHSNYEFGIFEARRISFKKSELNGKAHIYTTLLDHEI